MSELKHLRGYCLSHSWSWNCFNETFDEMLLVINPLGHLEYFLTHTCIILRKKIVLSWVFSDTYFYYLEEENSSPTILFIYSEFPFLLERSRGLQRDSHGLRADWYWENIYTWKTGWWRHLCPWYHGSITGRYFFKYLSGDWYSHRFILAGYLHQMYFRMIPLLLLY